MTRYEFRPGDRDRLPEFRDRWIAHAMRATPMTDEERRQCETALVEMYAIAGKPAPRVVFVTSPLIGVMAAGCAAWIEYSRGSTADATRAATRAATAAATWDATEAATRAATWDATRAATADATRAATADATWAATWDATRAATWDATRAATADATWDATWDATRAATADATEASLERWYVASGDIRAICLAIAGDGGLKCAASAWRMYQGGNQWADFPAMADFLREVAQLPVDWGKWMPWATLAEHSGPRWVHEKFCIISDFPAVLRVDSQNRPHCSTGPFCRWRDGFALYAWHGVRVPAWIIEQPERLTVAIIDAEPNAEIRRVMIDRYGFPRYLAEKGASVIDAAVDEGGEPMRLLSMPSDDDDGRPMLALHLRNSTPDPDGSRREYVVRVPPDCATAWQARNWTFQQDEAFRFDAVS